MSAPDPASVAESFLTEIRAALTAGQCRKLLLNKYRGDDDGLQRWSIRPVRLRERDMLTFVHEYRTRETTRNLDIDDGLREIGDALGALFDGAHLFTADADLEYRVDRKGKAALLRHKIAPSDKPVAAPLGHDHEKTRLLTLDRPFLHDLGVTDAKAQLIPAMSRKWKQINKFLEIFSHACAEARIPDGRPVRVLDFGSGKGYLTFAVHDWLTRTHGRDAHVTGVELRESLVSLCMDSARKHGLSGLDFYTGDVRSFDTPALDIMIALHACDIATDFAIHTGIRLGAEIILCAPCCHKEIRPQMRSPAVLQPLLKHGIHLGQEAEMITDGLRALLLEASGYDTQVFEFVSLEHTSKNKMILAVKRNKPRDAAPFRQQVSDIKAFYGIGTQCLERLLEGESGDGKEGCAC